jgi:UDP-N-acetyl-D-mannosaminuronate dehydrogenase|tara:strand:+ start:484 stop:588 length:105 start_codon:yes stop_codon:yes gene_type:complete
MKNKTIALIGLDYVDLPLAVIPNNEDKKLINNLN